MATLPYTFYPLGPDEPAGVFSWGKAPQLTESDALAGVARLGGQRTPNYCQAYLWSAGELLQTAMNKRLLDHHALPIFYLQRHAAELLLKAPLSLAVEVQKHRERLGIPASRFPTPGQAKRVHSSHNLMLLLKDLGAMLRDMQVGVIPQPLSEAVHQIVAIEKHATWARYEYSIQNDRLVHHMADEVIVPLRAIQGLLCRANDSLGALWPSTTGLVMGRLSEMLESALRSAGEIA